MQFEMYVFGGLNTIIRRLDGKLRRCVPACVTRQTRSAHAVGEMV